MTSAWPAVSYDQWGETCDTLHAHTQVLGKLAVELAPPEPELHHGALRLTARGWETAPLPAPDGSGSLVVALDLHSHHAVVEHSDGHAEQVPLTPDRPVADVTKEVLASVTRLGGHVQINPVPQEVPWDVPLDEDYEHARYDPAQVGDYFAAVTQAALALAEFSAPYRGRSTPVNAWWGSFDLAVTLYSGAPADPPGGGFITRNSSDAEQFVVGWWPGDAAPPERGVLRLRVPAARGVRGRHALPGRCPLGREPGRVHPGLARRAHCQEPAGRGRGVRPLGVPAHLRGVGGGAPTFLAAPRAARRPSGEGESGEGDEHQGPSAVWIRTARLLRALPRGRR